MDLTFLKPCSNRFHGCGYRDADGNVSGVIPLLAAREMFLRYQTMVKKNNPQGLLVLHGYAATPLALSYETEFMGDGRKLSFPWRYSFSLNEIMYRYIGFGFILPYEATKQSSSINNCSIIPTESCWARS